MSLLVEFIYQGKRAQSVIVVDEREGNRKARERLWGQPAGATATVTRYVRGVAPKVISRWCVGHDRTIVVDSLVSIPCFADASLRRSLARGLNPQRRCRLSPPHSSASVRRRGRDRAQVWPRSGLVVRRRRGVPAGAGLKVD